MALLFALGFLAMMLILGLAFVTTSLLAQKIAANNSSRAQARMFACSAAARAMLNIMLYNDQAALSGKTIENYDSIYSYDQVKYNKGDDNESTGAVTDQLHKSGENSSDESKLKYQVGNEDYTGENCKAQWMFFYDSPAGTAGRKIIGRAAFQVLPRQAGRLSLYAITGGSVKDGDFNQNTHTFRWGRDIAELDLSNTQTLKNWYTKVNSANIPYKYETMYTSYSSFFDTNPDMKKRWLEYWFAEGKNPILKDAFPKLDPNDKKGKKVIYINRFNISDYYYDAAERDNSANDNWYDRFKQTGHRTKGWPSVTDDLKNSKDALDALAQDAVAYKENHSQDSEVDPSGLPFLKCIGNDEWSFETLEALRRQIAANFNDYCDGDSIPTSNVKAAEWSVTGTAFPAYTGNERTLYINEAALELGVTAKFSAASGLTYDATGGGVNNRSKVELSVTPVLLAELVNMYDPDYGSAEAKALLDPASFEFQAGLKTLTLNIAVKAVFNIDYTYEIYNPNNGQRETGSGSTTATVNYSDNAVAKINYSSDSPAAKTVNNFGTLNSGYSVGNVTLDSLDDSTTQPVDSAFADKINSEVNAKLDALKSANTGKTVTLKVTKIGIETVGFQPQIDGNSKIEFTPFLLKVKSDAASAPESVRGKGVDFVRMDKAGKMTLIGSPAAQEEEPTGTGDNYKFRRVAYLGGIEARDPRQNLNPNFTTPKKSDWNLAPTVVAYSDAGNGERPVPSMNITVITDGEADTTARVTGGKVNTYSKPSNPQWLSNSGSATALESADVDKETVADPAWLGDTADKHVSTAYIRNAPMVSPWEIGLIHRAREWRTLNLKRAGGFGSNAEVQLADIDSGYNWTDEGTEYRNGDGAILEFIKVGVSCRCMGKVPLTLLAPKVIREGGTDWNEIEESYNKDIIKMLFDGIRVGQTMKQFYAETKFGEASGSTGTAITVDAGDITDFVKEVERLCALSGDSEFRMRSQFLNSEYGDRNGKYTFEMAQMDNDAQREELIGKTINLLTVNEVTPPNIFRVIVVAQSIRDVGGIGTDIPITKIHNDSNKELACQIGRFDFVSDSTNWENNTYFDEITGEVKALVTIERIPAVDENGNKNKDYGRMVITGIEFID